MITRILLNLLIQLFCHQYTLSTDLTYQTKPITNPPPPFLRKVVLVSFQGMQSRKRA